MSEMTIPLALPDDAVQRIAEVVERRIADRAAEPPGPWMTVPEAAAYLRCPEGRIRKLLMANAIPAHRDGRRVLFHRDELDGYVRSGGAFAG